jgi:hypothetical protein
MRRQPFKLRLELRPLENIVETSSTSTVAPKPWLQTLSIGGRSFTPLARTAIPSPTIQLETRHLYMDGESQLKLRSVSLEIPFTRPYENNFVFSSAEYAPLLKGVPSLVTRRLDAQHVASRIVWFIRSQSDIRANRRWKFAADISGQEYYVSQSLIIASRDREITFSPLIWNIITHHAKEDRDPGAGIGEMSWDLGDIRGRRSPWNRQPEGSVNFTTGDRPTFYTSLAAISDSVSEMTAIVDTWALYNIERDRGVLKYGN